MIDSLIEQADARYERKFFISDTSKDDVESAIKLHPAMFLEVYELRYINSIYFDSHGLDNYYQNTLGSNKRMKLRIRWYGNLCGLIEKPLLEFKIKIGMLCYKVSASISCIKVEENMDFDNLMENIRTSRIQELMKLQVITLEPSLCTRYLRRYYQSSDGGYRITLDSDIVYYKLNKYSNFFSHSYVDRINSIVELKYNPDKDDTAERISNSFPFRMTRSSKYLQGIESVYML